MIPTLTTRRLILRPLVIEDADAIQAVFPDWEVVKWLAAVVPWPYPPDGARAFLESALPHVDSGERFLWAITLRDDPAGRLIGVMDLFPNGEEDNRGFWLAPEHHRKGYMTEAAAAATDFAFDVLGLSQLILNNAETNIASHRLKEKAGAEIIGVREDVEFVGGKFRAVRWRLTKEAWHAHRESFLRRDPDAG